MQPTVLISGFNDEGLLSGAIASAKRLGWRVAYADGGYRLFVRPGESWRSCSEQLKEAQEADLILPAPPDAPWASEADKKTALLRTVHEDFGPGWVLFLDADERIEADKVPMKVGASPVAMVNIYRDDMGGVGRNGFMLPRLFRNSAGVHFRPPRDFDVYDGDGNLLCSPVEDASTRAWDVSPSTLRIRHDHYLRSIDRHNREGEYLVRRKAAHGSAVV